MPVSITLLGEEKDKDLGTNATVTFRFEVRCPEMKVTLPVAVPDRQDRAQSFADAKAALRRFAQGLLDAVPTIRG